MKYFLVRSDHNLFSSVCLTVGVHLDLRTPLAGTVKNIAADTELDKANVSFKHTFKISFLKAFQLTIIKELRTGNCDIFVKMNLPTAYAKSLIYQALASNFSQGPHLDTALCRLTFRLIVFNGLINTSDLPLIPFTFFFAISNRVSLL